MRTGPRLSLVPQSGEAGGLNQQPLVYKPSGLSFKQHAVAPMCCFAFDNLKIKLKYSKACVKWPIKNRQNKDLNDKW